MPRVAKQAAKMSAAEQYYLNKAKAHHIGFLSLRVGYMAARQAGLRDSRRRHPPYSGRSGRSGERP